MEPMSFQVTSALAEEPDDSIEVPVVMPPDMIAALRVAGFQRRSLGYGEVDLSGLVCEAVSEWLEREIEGTSTVRICL
jgi:hypothetical protein